MYTIGLVPMHLAVYISQFTKTLRAAGSASPRSMEEARLSIDWYVVYCREKAGRQMHQKASTAALHTNCSPWQKKAVGYVENDAGSMKALRQNVSLTGTITAQLRHPPPPPPEQSCRQVVHNMTHAVFITYCGSSYAVVLNKC